MLLKLKLPISVLKKNQKGRDTAQQHDPVVRAKTGKYAATSSNIAAVKKFSEQLEGKSAKAVCGFKKAYCSALSKTKGEESVRLEQ